jgi:hypothetical protein
MTWTNTNAPTLDFGGVGRHLNTYGSIILASGMTVVGSGGDVFFLYASTGTYNVTSNGVFINLPLYIQAGATYILQDNLHAKEFHLFLGTFNANNFNITANSFESNSTNIRTLKMGIGTWTLNGTGNIWDIANTTGLTFPFASSTIIINDTTGTEKAFYGGVLPYNIVTFSGDNIRIYDSNTFYTINDNATSSNGLILTSGTTQTVTNFTTNASTGHLAKIKTDNPGTPSILSKSNGTISIDYMSIMDSTATGGATWYAGSHSTNVSGNSGWIFTAPPTSTPSSNHRRTNTINILFESSTIPSVGNSSATATTSTTTIETATTTSTSPIIKPSVSTSAPSTGTQTPPYQFSFTKILKLGSVGDEVKQLQIFLNTHGFPISKSGNGSLSKETTYFGEKTKQALIKFQESNVKDILTPQGLTRGTGIFWIYSMKIANEMLSN